jgi:hypothetical protein
MSRYVNATVFFKDDKVQHQRFMKVRVSFESGWVQISDEHDECTTFPSEVVFKVETSHSSGWKREESKW